MSITQNTTVLLNRDQAGLGYYDFALNIPKKVSSSQIEAIQSLFNNKGFRTQLCIEKGNPNNVLFLAYDNVIGILQQAEREHIFKKKYRESENNVPGSKIRAFLHEKSLAKLDPRVSELEQTVSFNYARRRDFIKPGSPSKSRNFDQEVWEEYIDLFTQSELTRIIWAIIQSIQLNTTDPTIISLFNIKKADEAAFMTHRLVDFLMREHLLESATPLHTNAVEDSLKSSDHIADYFGNNIAIYFKFMAFYTKWLIIPAIFGVLRQIILIFDPNEDIIAFELDSIYCIMIVIWATMFIKKWRQTSTGICTKWNNTGTRFKSSDTRYNFKGKLGINVVTELPEYQFTTRWKLYVWSAFAHLPLMLFSAFVVILFLNVLGYIDPHHWVYISSLARLAQKDAILDKNTSWAYIPTILQSLVMNIIAIFNKKLAYVTTNWENHRTNTSFNNSMIFKRFFFEIINTFSPLLYIAFWRLELDAVRDELFALYTTDEIRRLVTETLIPYIQKKAMLKSISAAAKAKREVKQTHEDYMKEKMKELQLAEYESFDDYLEMITQFGYITLFATAFPLSGVLSLVFNFMEMKSDSLKLKLAYRRPIPTIVNGIGSWQSWINFMSHLCLVTNTILIGYSTTLKKAVGDDLFKNDECEQYKLLVMVFLMEHLVFIAVYVIRKKIKAEPTWVRVYLQRNIKNK